MKRIKVLALALAVGCGLSLFGRGAAAPPPNRSEAVVAPRAADTEHVQSVVPPAVAQVLGFAMADFGGDSRPDLAAVELGQSDSASADYRIAIRLTEGGRQSLRVTAPLGGLFIAAKDVTGDGSLDLLVSARSTGALVGVFVNDGKGHFEQANKRDLPKNQRPEPFSSSFSSRRFYAGLTFATPESHAFDRPANEIVFRTADHRSFVFEHNPVTSQILHSCWIGRAPPYLS